MKKPVRLLLVDDHPFFTEGVANVLKSNSGYTVVGAVDNGLEVLKAIETLEPDVVILDINLPSVNGIELFAQIKQFRPAVKVMMLSMYMPGSIRFDPFREGVDAYVIKNSGKDVLLEALETLSAGDRFMDPAIQPANDHSADSFVQSLRLSSREKEILRLLKLGFTNRQIAAELYISELTVKTHRKNIMAKLDVRNLAELINRSPM